MCPHAKKPLYGCEKPYLVCLNPRTRIVKCRDERRCPLLASGNPDGQCAVDDLRSDPGASTAASVEQMDLFRGGTREVEDVVEDISYDRDDDLSYDMFA